MRLPVIIFTLFAFTLPDYVQANTIFKCKDGNGKVVFQQTACDQDSVVGNSEAHRLWREMRVLSAQGSAILNSLGGDLESIKECNRNMEIYQKKVNSLAHRVARVAKDHQHLATAYSYLKECSVCRTSAESNCIAASKSLDKAVNQLTEF